MKTVIMIFAAVSVIAFDITTVTVTFCWICGALDLDANQGMTLFFMWLIAMLITAMVAAIANEDD